MPYAVIEEKYTARKVPGTVMVSEFNAAFCKVICIPFCFARRFFQFSIRWPDGMREIPDLMASELLVAFMIKTAPVQEYRKSHILQYGKSAAAL